MPPFNLLRWKIFFNVLPWTSIFLVVKWLIHLKGWEVWQFDLMTGSLFGAATFVIAFILSGTLSDYRSSEEMVAQLASAIESIQDTALLVAAGHPDYDPTALCQSLKQALQSVLNWLKQGDSLETVNRDLTALNPQFAQLEAHTSGPIISRIQGEQGKIRLLLTRMQMIRDTDFLLPAYGLLQIFLLGAILALLLIGSDQSSKTLVVSAFLFTSFLYLVALIRDLDNPFQYDGTSCVDVDLMPLLALLNRLDTNLNGVERGLN